MRRHRPARTDKPSLRMHIMGESLMKWTRASCSAVMRRSGMHGASLSSRSRPQHGLLMACPISSPSLCACVHLSAPLKLPTPPPTRSCLLRDACSRPIPVARRGARIEVNFNLNLAGRLIFDSQCSFGLECRYFGFKRVFLYDKMFSQATQATKKWSKDPYPYSRYQHW